jgi:predicted dehydrogenase
MPQLHRRNFLKGSLAAAATVSLSARVRAQAEGANSDIRIAIIGFNGRGNAHIAGYRNKDGTPKKGVRIVALCDVDTKVLEKGVAQLAAKNITVETYQDIRKLLDSKEVDAISIATPNHWHSLGAIWGCQAGKDVYVEKPVSHNVWEGRQLVKAAEKYNRVVQMGVQSRSAAGLAAAVKWAKGGELGKLQYVRGLCYKPRPSIGKVDAPQPVPENIDYDLWCGPAPMAPVMRTKFHYDWHWIWATGNGDLGNQGIHQMDIARRFLGEQALSPRVFSIGGRLGYIDDGETPNSQIIFHDYPKAPLIFEVRGLPEKTDSKAMDKYRKVSVGVIVQYEQGHIECPNHSDAYVYDNDGNQVQKLDEKSAPDWGTEDHFENFLDCVRSRKTAALNGQILDGHISSALCHTGNVSHLLGKKAAPDKMREKIKGNKDAMDSFERLATHMDANGVDLKVDQLTLGEFLKMNPETEKFIDNPAADKLLTRDYRKPYVVPEIA